MEGVKLMYRDLIGDPEKIFSNGREWWIQTFCHMNGTVKAVRLFDSDGDFVAEFPNEEEVRYFINGVISRSGPTGGVATTVCARAI